MCERFTSQFRKVLERANHEGRRLRHEFIDTEHILWALIQEDAGVVPDVLREPGVDLDEIRREVGYLESADLDVASGTQLPMSPRAKKVFESSQKVARTLNHEYVGPEHILLGLLREEGHAAYRVLTNLGLNLNDV